MAVLPLAFESDDEEEDGFWGVFGALIVGKSCT
jgi:hypothetical protein